MSLEELMNVEVALVSRRTEKLSDVPAAVHIVSGEDLRRTGVRTLPEALRLVPGVHVARVDASKWGVTARGFNNLFANKLLVLVDGRSVYTPAFSGVFWEVQDVLMADVERLEVIRGPGGTLWGANAVNGIINVVTRPAAEAQGTYLRLGSGTAERLGVSLRHGASISETVSIRVYAKYFSREASADSSNADLSDDWSITRAGARLDWMPSVADRVAVDAGAYDGQVGQTLQVAAALTPPYVRTFASESPVRGGHLMGRWEHRYGPGSEFALKVYLDHSYRDDGVVGGTIDVGDLDFQHRRQFGRHGFTWGLGYRGMADEVTGSFVVTVDPRERTTHLWSGFLQGDIVLAPERLGVTAGSKIQHNSFTGFEWQPSGRLWWSPAPHHMLWSAVSRAVRTPSRSEDDMQFVSQILPDTRIGDSTRPAMVTVVGRRSSESEVLTAFEVGYRARLGPAVLADATVFYNRYDDLHTNELGLPVARDVPSPRHWYIPVRAANRGEAETFGTEVTGTWQAHDRLRITGAYAYLQMDLSIEAGSLDELFVSQERENPHHQFSLRASADIERGWQLDGVLRYVDELPAQRIPRYLTLDARLGWQPRDGMELSVAGRHLLQSRHPEFAPQVAVTVPGEVEADLYTSIAWRF